MSTFENTLCHLWACTINNSFDTKLPRQRCIYISIEFMCFDDQAYHTFSLTQCPLSISVHFSLSSPLPLLLPLFLLFFFFSVSLPQTHIRLTAKCNLSIQSMFPQFAFDHGKCTLYLHQIVYFTQMTRNAWKYHEESQITRIDWCTYIFSGPINECNM